jgi:glyoxylase-like metal-dependent hydrolase (beta-lactamase superfamily II)
MNRRDILRGAVAGALGLIAKAQSAGKPTVVSAGGANVVAFSSDEGLVLVDSGPANAAAQLTTTLKDALGIGGHSFAFGQSPGATKVQTLFNTHYHLDQTGNNEMFRAAGAKIIAHERTRQWMSADYWVPEEERYEKARPEAARPTEVFLTTGSLKAGTEQIDYGYLPLAHTSGDIYVFFKNANVLAVGDVASPVRDPALDWFTGAWIGGRVDAMDLLLKLSNDQTRIVPAYGPMMTKAEFKAERDVMEELRARLFKTVREGDGPKDMLDEGVLKGLARTWKDPNKFLYDAAKGLWAHHDKLDPNVV